MGLIGNEHSASLMLVSGGSFDKVVVTMIVWSMKSILEIERLEAMLP